MLMLLLLLPPLLLVRMLVMLVRTLVVVFFSDAGAGGNDTGWCDPSAQSNPVGISDAALTEANVAAVKKLVSITDSYPRVSTERTTITGYNGIVPVWGSRKCRHYRSDSRRYPASRHCCTACAPIWV